MAALSFVGLFVVGGCSTCFTLLDLRPGRCLPDEDIQPSGEHRFTVLDDLDETRSRECRQTASAPAS